MWQMVDHIVIPCKPTAEDKKRAAKKPGIYDENFKLVEHQPPPWKKKNARSR